MEIGFFGKGPAYGVEMDCAKFKMTLSYRPFLAPFRRFISTPRTSLRSVALRNAFADAVRAKSFSPKNSLCFILREPL